MKACVTRKRKGTTFWPIICGRVIGPTPIGRTTCVREGLSDVHRAVCKLMNSHRQYEYKRNLISRIASSHSVKDIIHRPNTEYNPWRTSMPGDLVLVTGGTGYIGKHVVKALLEHVLIPQFRFNLTIVRAPSFALSFATKRKAMSWNHSSPHTPTNSKLLLSKTLRNLTHMTMLFKALI